MTSPVSTTHPNVVAENVMALTVLSGLEGAPTLSVFALPSTLSRPKSARASTRDHQADARETDPDQ